MSGSLFIFGNTPDLSRAELSVFFPGSQLISRDVAIIESDVDPAVWIERLGGTVKIAKIITCLFVLDPKNIAACLENNSTQRISFGISSYSSDFRVNVSFLQQVKDELLIKRITSRFVAPKEGNVLSSVVVAKQELIELIVVGKEGEWTIGKTVAVQDFEEWNRRDYGRPAVDPKAGMLPPKVARMAVNLAGDPKVLLDPFCGMGTILGEALLMGWRVIGSDISSEVIVKTRKNLEWITQGDPLRSKESPCKLFVSDATHVSPNIVAESIDAIVTEPFMGPALGGNDKFPMSNDKIKNHVKGLEKLYIGCLRDWKKVLKPGGKVVIALPQYAVGGREYFVKSVIDRCETLGYTLLAGPIAYNRPQAVVRRKFYIFQKVKLWRILKQAVPQKEIKTPQPNGWGSKFTAANGLLPATSSSGKKEQKSVPVAA